MDKHKEMDFAYTLPEKQLEVPASAEHVNRVVTICPVSERAMDYLRSATSGDLFPIMTVKRDGYRDQIMYVGEGTVANHQAPGRDGTTYDHDPHQTGWVLAAAWVETLYPNHRWNRSIFEWAKGVGYSPEYLLGVFQKDVAALSENWWGRCSVRHLSIAPKLVPEPLPF